eukprot:1092393-Rhodomonas_salina.3
MLLPGGRVEESLQPRVVLWSYAMFGTDVARGTDIACGAISSYAISGTDVAYAAATTRRGGPEGKAGKRLLEPLQNILLRQADNVREAARRGREGGREKEREGGKEVIEALVRSSLAALRYDPTLWYGMAGGVCHTGRAAEERDSTRYCLSMCLRPCYALPGTDVGYAPTRRVRTSRRKGGRTS